MIKIVTDQAHAERFCQWISERFEEASYLDPAVTRTIGSVEFTDAADDKLSANVLLVAAFHHWSEHACEITVATNGEKRRKASPEFVWTCFHHVFEVWKKSAIFATISQENAKCLARTLALGFSERGRIPDYFGKGNDALILSITRDEWLEGPYVQPMKPDPGINTFDVVTAPKTYKDVLH